MKIKAEAINGAIEKVKLIASQDKNPPGVLLDIGESSVSLFYTTNSKAITCVIDAEIDPSEYHGKAIFDYKRFIDIFGQSATSNGIVKVEDVDFVLNKNPDNTGTAVVTSVKFVDRVTEGGESYQRKVSDNSYDLSWWEVSQASVRQKVLGVSPCDMFPEDSNAVATDTVEFYTLLDNVMGGDASVVYMSQKIAGVFVSNTNSVAFARAKTADSISKTVQFGTPTAKAISSVLKKIDAETINLATLQSDDKDTACLFFDDTHTFSLYMGLVAERKVDISRTNSFRNIPYGTYQLTFINPVLTDILKSAYNISPNANIKLKIMKDKTGESPSGVEVAIDAIDSGASVSNKYAVKCETFNTATEVDGDMYMEFETNLKNLLDVVSSGKTEYVGLDVEENSKGIYLRVGFFGIDRCLEETNKAQEDKKGKAEAALAEANEANSEAKAAKANKANIQIALDKAKDILDKAKSAHDGMCSDREATASNLAINDDEIRQIVGTPESSLEGIKEHREAMAKHLEVLDTSIPDAKAAVDLAEAEVNKLAGELELATINEADALKKYTSAYEKQNRPSNLSIADKIALREKYIDLCYYLPLKKS